jgi:hypothetical protein
MPIVGATHRPPALEVDWTGMEGEWGPPWGLRADAASLRGVAEANRALVLEIDGERPVSC